ncbi:MAG: hypothetical protein ACREFZ_03135 [Acetobacteraceae bacterium]
MEVAVDALEAEARRRALEGVATAVVYGGRVVLDNAGAPLTIRRYSDALLTLLLRAHRPEKYRLRDSPRKDAPGTNDVAFTIRIGKRPDPAQPVADECDDQSD